ncbi:MAG: hypothetical protein A2Z18_10750 [Armatimonadetes bacterium RBG_16_58_9]|nr:MAG: hypothetical protein A2Z18_10750 [Armatimonadetes bacterium RBG_16_58_9]
MEYEKLLNLHQRSPGSSAPDRVTVIGPTEYRTRWTFKGIRSRYETRRVRKPDETTSLKDHAIVGFDGTTSTEYYPQSKEANVSAGQHARFIAMKESRLVGEEGLVRMLEGKDSVYEGRQTVGDTDCYKITVAQESAKLEAWVTEDFHVKRLATSTTYPDGYGGYLLREVESFAQHEGGIRYPAKGKMGDFLRTPEGSKQWRTTVEWSVSQYSPMAAVSLFDLKLPAGTRVVHMAGGNLVTFTVGE